MSNIVVAVLCGWFGTACAPGYLPNGERELRPPRAGIQVGSLYYGKADGQRFISGQFAASLFSQFSHLRNNFGQPTAGGGRRFALEPSAQRIAEWCSDTNGDFGA